MSWGKAVWKAGQFQYKPVQTTGEPAVLRSVAWGGCSRSFSFRVLQPNLGLLGAFLRPLLPPWGHDGLENLPLQTPRSFLCFSCE